MTQKTKKEKETKKVIICSRCGDKITDGRVYSDEDGNKFCEHCYYKLLDMFA